MNQQEMEKEIQALKERLEGEVNRIHGLESQVAALRKQVRQIEANLYKNIEPDEDRED